MKYIITIGFLILNLLTQAQTITFPTNSGPSFKAVNYSPAFAGPNWNQPSYNDSAWIPANNGGGLEAGGTCYGYGSCVFCTGDTVIWSSSVCTPPDTSCFRKFFNFGNCGHITSATFTIVSDDFFWAYLNGHFLDSNTVRDNAVVLHLDSTQLSWLHTGDNLIAAEVNHPIPYCAIYSMIGSVTVDTTGCVNTGMNQISIVSMSVSPNPALNNLDITISDFNPPYTFTLYDVLGNKVFAQTSNSTHTTIDISRLTKGIYILQAMKSNGEILSHKISKE